MKIEFCWTTYLFNMSSIYVSVNAITLFKTSANSLTVGFSAPLCTLFQDEVKVPVTGNIFSIYPSRPICIAHIYKQILWDPSKFMNPLYLFQCSSLYPVDQYWWSISNPGASLTSPIFLPYPDINRRSQTSANSLSICSRAPLLFSVCRQMGCQ